MSKTEDITAAYKTLSLSLFKAYLVQLHIKSISPAGTPRYTEKTAHFSQQHILEEYRKYADGKNNSSHTPGDLLGTKLIEYVLYNIAEERQEQRLKKSVSVHNFLL